MQTLKFVTNAPLNRKSKIKALAHMVRWQVASRLALGDTVYPWVNGSKFFVNNKELGLTGNIYTGLHEFNDMGFLLHNLREEDLFIDVGANVGSYTILACAAVGARGYAFEPIPSTYARLVENIRLNHLEERVKCVNQGIGAEQGVIAFTNDLNTVNHALADGEQTGNVTKVDVTTLDAVLNNESPTMLKIDVEGYETLVIEGANETLQKPSLNSIIIELSGIGKRYGFDESKLVDRITGYGFSAYDYDPLKRELTPRKCENLSEGSDNIWRIQF